MSRIIGLDQSIALTENILVKSVSYDNIYYTCEIEQNYQTVLDVVVGDVLRCENSLYGEYYGIVEAVDNINYIISIRATTIIGNSSPNEGDLLLRFGHVSNNDRQGVLYLTQDEYNSPCLVVYDNVKDNLLRGKELVKIGSLGGIIDPYFGTLVGKGAYIKNGYISAKINAQEGSNVYSKYEIDNFITDIKQYVTQSISEINIAESVNLAPILKLIKDVTDKATQTALTIDDIIDESIFTPFEKQLIDREWKRIRAEKPVIISQIGRYNINYDKYVETYEALKSYIEPMLAKPNENSTIVRNDFTMKFQDYYVQYSKLLSSNSDQAYTGAQEIIRTIETIRENYYTVEERITEISNVVNNNVTNNTSNSTTYINNKDQLLNKVSEIESDYLKFYQRSVSYYTPEQMEDEGSLWYLLKESYDYFRSYVDPYLVATPEVVTPTEPVEGDNTDVTIIDIDINQNTLLEIILGYYLCRNNLENELIRITKDKVAELALNKEDKANKQNSLSPDGTGTKYPTVDAVNAGLADIRNTIFDKYFEYIQADASNYWVINHRMNKKPAVTVTDTAGSIMVGEIKHIDTNNLTITFGFPFSGIASLN